MLSRTVYVMQDRACRHLVGWRSTVVIKTRGPAWQSDTDILTETGDTVAQ